MVIVDAVEEQLPDPHTNAQFADPLPGQLANIAAPPMIQYRSPHCAELKPACSHMRL